MGARCGTVPALAAAILAAGPADGSAAQGREVPLEYAVKAAYLPKFANYVEWPASAFRAPDSAITLCIVGPDPFGDDAEQAIQSQQVGERHIVLRHLSSVARDSGCQILFVGGEDPKKVGLALDAVRGEGVLTVTEAQSAGKTASVIRFVIEDKHVRFTIDAEAAAQNGLSLSSKLLRLALAASPQQ